MEEAQELSDRVGIMDHGEIIALGTQDELVQRVGEVDMILKIGGSEIDEGLQGPAPARCSGHHSSVG